VAHTEVEEVRVGTDQRCLVIPWVAHVHGAFSAAEWVKGCHHVKLLEEGQAKVGGNCQNE